jgi:hypothetical protein
MKELIRIREDGLHDYNSDINSAERKGRMEGRMEWKREAAVNLIAAGVDVNIISNSLGLSALEIEALKSRS